MDLEKELRKYALQNAIRFNGQASPGAVIGKVLAEDPSLKAKMGEVGKLASKVVFDVNKMSVEDQIKELQKTAPDLLVEKPKVERKKELPELKGAVKGKVIMRFAPSPSGPMHIGHAYACTPSSEYCRKYDGKLILRIEDTNPENIDPEAYSLLPEDGQWITKSNIKEVIIQSDRLGVYYDYAEKLISMGGAYVCTCTSDDFRALVFKEQACPCRELPKKEHQLRFQKMFSEYKPGDAVLRIKTDIHHKNPAMRDFPLMRINEFKHPRQGTKYRVWPLMNFSVFVDDVESGMTHIIRGKDHYDNAKRQEYLFNYFRKPIPVTLFVGRINFEGMAVSCSETRKLIEEGKYSGWDDIRLPFLRALMRRGYHADAFIRWSLDVGVNMSDKTITKDEYFKTLDSYNKDIIDPVSNRHFFVWNPKEIKISGAPTQKMELDLHPEHPKKGKRKFSADESFYICEDDMKHMLDGRLYRLMDCLNFTKKGSAFKFDSLEYEKYKDKGEKIIHWLPAKETVKVEVHMPDDGKTVVKGFGEKAMESIKVGDIVQLERFGFCRLDEKKKDRLVFWFTHK